MTVMALEIGPARFAAARVAPDGGLQDVQAVPIPSRAPWNACRDLLTEVAAGSEVTGLGIGATGPIDMAAGVAAPPDIPDWRIGFDVVEAAQKLFPSAPVGMALDGVCVALAEQAYGSLRGVPDALAVAVSTRICGGIVVGGFCAVGRTGNAGNIGHMVMPGYDDPCDCGGKGCVQAIASGAAMVRWAREQGWAGDDFAALTDAAGSGDPIADAAVRRAGTVLGQALSSVASLLDIDRVVVGGFVAQAGPVLWGPVREAVAAHARIGFLSGIRVEPSRLGDTAVLAGAGILASPPQQR
ncbi:ROK family protein [Nocardia uniformis]|uniref:ROK family protein n=1 Tax=Nocardia uniformis TaxID=53432 RepID=A0A849C3A6_9NOCA|nr:ROK family protein [Nocardia uniformis]NNH73213.1 ROK family protein [Nocardia uniformis]